MSLIARSPCDAAFVQHGAAAIPCASSTKRWVLASAIVGSSMAFIDGTVVNVALPTIQRDLQANGFEAQWVVESYALFLAALLLVGGALGDRFGRRNVFMLGVGLFSLASIACALSPDVRALILARGVQGIGAALLVPGSLALISASFPRPERGQAIGTWSACSGITAALGPVIGGWLVEHYAWMWAFLINVPLGVAVLIMTGSRVPESRSGAAGPIDLWGAGLGTIGLAGVVYALIEGPSQGWRSPSIVIVLLLGIVSLALFVVVERRLSSPMLPVELFRIHNFAGSNLVTLLLYAALGGALFYVPLDLIQVQRYSASQAGAALLPFITIMFLLSRWSGRLVDRVGARLPLVVGPLIAALGFALCAVPGIGGSYWSTFFPALLVLGLGMSISVSPLTTTVMNSVSPELAGIASGVNNAVSRAAGLLAIAGFGIVMTWAFDIRLKSGLDTLQLPADVTTFLWFERSKLAGANLPPHVSDAVRAMLRRTVSVAFLSGFTWVMMLSAGLAVLSAVCAWVSIDARPQV